MRGKLVILLMVLIGCAMGGLSVAYHHWLGRRAIAWWGSDNVELITHAPRVDVLRFTKADESDPGKVVTINGTGYFVEQRKDVTAANGMDHLRHGLLEDGNFSWSEPSQLSTAPTWAFGLEFIDGERKLMVAFDRGRQIGRLDGNQTLSIAPIATGWKEFFAEQETEVGGRRSEVREVPAH